MTLKIINTSLLPLLCLLVVISYGSNIKLERSSNNNSKNFIIADKFSKLIYKIGSKYFYRGKVIYVVIPTEKENGNMLHLLEKVIQKMSKFWTVITSDNSCSDTNEQWSLPYRSTLKINFPPDVYIIPIVQNQSLLYFKMQMLKMEKREWFNHSAIFIILQLTEKCGALEGDRNQIARIFRQMWLKNLFATTVMILSQCDLYLTTITARPYSSEHPCGEINEKGMKYYRSILDDEQFNEINITLFQYKWNNLQGCVFWTGTIPFFPYVVGKQILIDGQTHYDYVGGIDIALLRTFSDKKNLLMKFHKPHIYDLSAWFERFENGTIVGILQDTLKHKIDICCGGVIPSYVSYHMYDNSPSYKFSAVSWYVSDAKLLPQWKIFFGAFPLEVWILLAIVFIIVSLLYNIMEWYSLYEQKKFNVYNLYKLPLANLFRTGIGLSSTLQPRSSYLRVLFFSWALYSMQWTIAYSTVLFTLLTHPPYENEIRTVQELKDSGLKVGIAPLYLEYFNNIDQDELTQSLLDNRIECYQEETCIKQFVEFKNFSIMEKEENVELRVNLEQSRIHKLLDKMLSFSINVFTDKGSILSQELNSVVLRCFQSGLLLKWERDTLLYFNTLRGNQSETEDVVAPLKIEDLKGAFFILLFGLTTAFLVFIGELLFSAIKIKNRQKIIDMKSNLQK